MSQLRQGEVLLSHQIECHKGSLNALEGQQLVTIFLGTCREGEIPAVVSHMAACGWIKADVYEVVADLSDIAKRRTLFQADSEHAAAESAVLFARRQAMDFGAKVTSVEVRVVRIGEVGSDGVADHRRIGRAVLSWDESNRDTLDEAVAKLAD